MKTVGWPSVPRTVKRTLLGLLFILSVAGTASAATFVVNHAGDDNDFDPGDGSCATAGAVCTLRAAVQEANALAGSDEIQFSNGLVGSTITIYSAIPLDSDIHLNARSMTGWTVGVPSTTVTVEGSGIPNLGGGGVTPAQMRTSTCIAVHDSTTVTIDGLAIDTCPRAVFSDDATSLTIRGNTIHNIANAQNAALHVGATTLTIGGANVNDRNHIGVDAAGNGGVNNVVNHGIQMRNNAGHTATVQNNVLANFNVVGIIGNSGTITIKDNTIGFGINSAGTLTTSTTASLNGNTGFFAPDNIVTGTVEGNQIGKMSVRGMHIDDPDVTVIDNRIGLFPDGSKAQISGPGIDLDKAATIGSTTKGNRIEKVDEEGIRVNGGASGADIIGNIITDVGGDGIEISGSATGVKLSQNRIKGSGGLAIDLIGVDGVNANDGALDADTGPNNLQNFPNFNGTFTNGRVQGSLNTTAGSHTIELFSNSACDASGNGEASTYIGAFQVTVPGSGSLEFNVSTGFSLSNVVTATARNDGNDDTSELSACITAGTDPYASSSSSSSPSTSNSPPRRPFHPAEETLQFSGAQWTGESHPYRCLSAWTIALSQEAETTLRSNWRKPSTLDSLPLGTPTQWACDIQVEADNADVLSLEFSFVSHPAHLNRAPAELLQIHHWDGKEWTAVRTDYEPEGLKVRMTFWPEEPGLFVLMEHDEPWTMPVPATEPAETSSDDTAPVATGDGGWFAPITVLALLLTGGTVWFLIAWYRRRQPNDR